MTLKLGPVAGDFVNPRSGSVCQHPNGARLILVVSCGEQILQLLGGHRARDVEALRLVATKLAQEVQLDRVLHAFCHHAFAQAVPQGHDGAEPTHAGRGGVAHPSVHRLRRQFRRHDPSVVRHQPDRVGAHARTQPPSTRASDSQLGRSARLIWRAVDRLGGRFENLTMIGGVRMIITVPWPSQF